MVDSFFIIVFLGMKLLQVCREQSRIRTPHSMRSLHQLQKVTTITICIRKPSPGSSWTSRRTMPSSQPDGHGNHPHCTCFRRFISVADVTVDDSLGLLT